MRRARRPWTPEDDALLRKFHAEGKTDPTIAYILDRNPRFVGYKRARLGLKANSMGGMRKGDYTHSAEARAKSGEASRKRWQDPEYRARMMAHLRRATEKSLINRVKPPPRGTPQSTVYRKLLRELGQDEAHKFIRAMPTP